MTHTGSMTFEDRAGEPWVVLTGEIDYAVAAVHTITDEAIEASHAEGQRFTVDMTEVTFIDSIGIAFMLRLHAAARGIRLINVPTRARRVFASAGLTELFGLA